MQKTLKPPINNNNTKKEQQSSALINEKIRAAQVQLITHEGENVGIVSRFDALKRADAAGLDLVMISAGRATKAFLLLKLWILARFCTRKRRKQTESKKHQKIIQVKEIKLSPKIGEHDYQTKIKQALQFLQEGKRVKVTLFFKGREITTKEERGAELFDKMNKSFEDFIFER